MANEDKDYRTLGVEPARPEGYGGINTQTRRTFDQFIKEIHDICDKSARGKGYNETGIDGKNQLYEFIENMNRGHQHALGEIVYKATRYARKNDPTDLVKIAAWAFLIWREGTK